MEIGKVQFAEGEYIGQISNGKANGFGYLKYTEGGFYIGEWQDNCQTGIGAKSVKQYNALGTFLNGKRHGDFCIIEKQASSNRRDCYYIGEYKNDLKNGKGVYLDGEEGEAVYLGHYSNDKLNGVGYELSYPRNSSGRFDKGNFTNGKMVGKVYSFPRRESKNLSGVPTSTFYGESEEVGTGVFTYSGFGVHCNGFTSKTRVTKIGYHKMNGNDDFEGVKIYQKEGTVDRAAVAIGKWNGEYYGMNGYFSRIGHDGSLDMGNYRDGKPFGKGIEFHPSGYGTAAQIIINDGTQAVTVFAKDNRFLRVVNLNSKKEAVYDSDGKVYENLCSGNIIGRFEIHTYQGTLNDGANTSYVGASSNVGANTATYQANTVTSQNVGANKSTSSSGKNVSSSTQKPREKTVDDDFEEFKYTGPYADLVIDDLPSSDWGKSKRIESQKPSFEPVKSQQSVFEPIQTPVQPEQKTYDYGDEYGEKISFKDRVKLEIANKKEMREAKGKANAPQKSTPAVQSYSGGSSDKIAELNRIFEFKNNRSEIVSIKVRQESYVIPPTVEKMPDGLFKDDKLVKEVKFESQKVIVPSDCFSGCDNLEKVDMSKAKSVLLCGNCFEDCKKLESVDMSKAEYITFFDEVFKDCVGLKQILIPENTLVSAFSEDIFENVGNIKIYCKKNKNYYYDKESFLEHFLEPCELREEIKNRINARKQKEENAKKEEERKKDAILNEIRIKDSVEKADAIVERRGEKLYLKGYKSKKEYAVVPHGVTLIDNNSFSSIKDTVKNIAFEHNELGEHIRVFDTGVFDGLKNLATVFAPTVEFVPKDIFRDNENIERLVVCVVAKIEKGAFPKNFRVKKKRTQIKCGGTFYRGLNGMPAMEYNFKKKKSLFSWLKRK